VNGEGIVSLSVCHAVCMCVCCISLGAEGDVLYPVLSSFSCVFQVWLSVPVQFIARKDLSLK